MHRLRTSYSDGLFDRVRRSTSVHISRRSDKHGGFTLEGEQYNIEFAKVKDSCGAKSFFAPQLPLQDFLSFFAEKAQGIAEINFLQRLIGKIHLC